MSKNRRTRTKDNSATWWIVGLIAVMVVLALITLNGLPAVTRDRALNAGTSQGAADAPVVLEEYGDFQCPACALFARQTLGQIEEKYVSTGQVRIDYHHFAFIGEESIRAAEAAECAGEQNAFWQYYDTLYNSQAGENVGAFRDERLIQFASGLNLDTTAFQQCMTDRRYLSKIEADTGEGRTRGVSSTPTFFINGQKVVGAISMAEFEARIATLLDAAK